MRRIAENRAKFLGFWQLLYRDDRAPRHAILSDLHVHHVWLRGVPSFDGFTQLPKEDFGTSHPATNAWTSSSNFTASLSILT